MNQYLAASQIVISIILIALILLQAQSGTGLGGSWSGGGETYHTRRGVEKLVFWATIVFIVIFTGLSLLSVVS
ncbi:MAG: preprotein translocase subunit SecG [Candidatus Pacebacteria bacterium]|nr:preprotein translocase subunit SecG [Candidatus Paceibacterota bacterium]